MKRKRKELLCISSFNTTFTLPARSAEHRIPGQPVGLSNPHRITGISSGHFVIFHQCMTPNGSAGLVTRDSCGLTFNQV